MKNNSHDSSQTKKNKIETVAIIPVRGNSKRIPGKNLRVFAGKVLFCWTIDAAMQSPEIDFVILSTESKEIADAANRYVHDTYPQHFGLNKDFTRFNVYMRPPELSQDHVQTDEVVLFVLRQMQAQGLNPEVIVTLLATSPLRNAADVTAAVRLHYRNSPATVISGGYAAGFYWRSSMTRIPLPMSIVISTGEDYSITSSRDLVAVGEPLETNPAIRPGTQWVKKHDKLFKEDGAVYVTSAEKLEAHRTKMIPPFILYETGTSVDIDTEEDWKNAERLVVSRQPTE